MQFKMWLKNELKKGSIKSDSKEYYFAKTVVQDNGFQDFQTAKELDTYFSFNGVSKTARKIGNTLFKRWHSLKAKKKKKPEIAIFDGFNDKDKKNVRRVLRQAWSWSYSRRLVVNRCDIGEGYSRCELCKLKVPKITVDHIKPIGVVDAGFLMRLFVGSDKMRGLCTACHKIKTKLDIKAIKAAKSAIDDFY